MSAVCREIRSTTMDRAIVAQGQTVADELFAEGRESNNGPPARLKTYLGAPELELNSLI